MIDGQNFFYQPVKYQIRTYDNILKIMASQEDNYTTDYRLDYSYFKENYKKIATDLSKGQALDADPKTLQQITFTGNLNQRGNTAVSFIINEFSDFSQGKVGVL